MNPEELQLLQEVQTLRTDLRQLTRLQRLSNLLTAAFLGLAAYNVWRSAKRDDDQGDDLVLVVGADRRADPRTRSVDG